MIKLIFTGTPDFSAVVLNGLLSDSNYDVLAVVTQPDRTVGCKKEIKMTPVKEAALAYSLLVYQPEKMSGSEEMAELMTLSADGTVIAASDQLLPAKLLDSIDFAVSVHTSPLPRHRGGVPIHYAIINGEEEAGVTIIEMVRGMNAGDTVTKVPMPIADDGNIGTMPEKLAAIGCDLLLRTLPDYVAGNIKPELQDEGKAAFLSDITPEEERIDWNKSTRDISNHVRGLYSRPVAHILLGSKRFKIYEVVLTEGHGRPGEITGGSKKSFVVAAGNGAILLKVAQPAGEPRMSVVDFLDGVGRKPGAGDLVGE